MRQIFVVTFMLWFLICLRKTETVLVSTTETFLKKGSNIEKYKFSVGRCECAIFDNMQQQKNPILSQSLRNASCTIHGEISCSKLCTRLVNANEDRTPKIICRLIKNTNKFEASVFSRICKAAIWTYTGLTLANYICCRDYTVTGCNDFHFHNKTSH